MIRPRVNSLALILWGLLIAQPLLGAPGIPAELHQSILTCIDFIYKDQFKLSDNEAKKIIKAFPGHPAGYFFYAVSLDAWMNYTQSSSKEDEFYRACDKAIEVGEALLAKEPGNAWAEFFAGGANGYKGTYESRYERWITAFRYGWNGVSVLTSVAKQNPDLIDAQYGIGAYEYWRSAMMKTMWWMPGVPDSRAAGIERLRQVRLKGVYTRLSASAQLILVLLNEKRFGEAEVLCNEMLALYPMSLAFSFGKANALLGEANYAGADPLFKALLARVESDPASNHYNAALCRVSLAKSAFMQGKKNEAIAYSDQVLACAYAVDIKKRLEKVVLEVVEVKKKALALP